MIEKVTFEGKLLYLEGSQDQMSKKKDRKVGNSRKERKKGRENECDEKKEI